MTKPTSENNTQTTYDSDNATRNLNMETTIEIGYYFMKILQYNAFNGIDGADVVNHITKVLEISEWIKIPNADKDQLRLHVFPISLSGRAREWWDNEIKGTDEEFITLSPSKYNAWGKTHGSVSSIYHDLFNKKFRGWMQYGVSLGLRYGILTTCTDLAVKKSKIWYTLKKTCVELVRAF
ncbi:hypothetical protein Tco_1097550 [Tanacetum coccineum]